MARVWSTVEECTTRLGGPRTGKSGELTCRILDAPGAVIATSTRTDLLENTRRQRGEQGPLWILNPQRLGQIPSTVFFDPLAGCEDPEVAGPRAEDMLPRPEGGNDDRGHWVDQARAVLEALMHAAALADEPMSRILEWVADPDRYAVTVRRILSRSASPMYAARAKAFFETNERTRSSITTTMMPALSWVTKKSILEITTPGSGRDAFDVDRLIQQNGTLYLLGKGDSGVAPVFAALAGTIARRAEQLASQQPSGRLNPGLTMALDEAALICPLPLPQWTSDMGGRNIALHIGTQSPDHLVATWGQVGTNMILNNSTTILVFGGLAFGEAVEQLSRVTGTTTRQLATYDADGELVSRSEAEVPIVSHAELHQLPPRYALVLRRGMPPAIGRVRMAWERPDVRLASLRGLAERQVSWLTSAVDSLRFRRRVLDLADAEALFPAELAPTGTDDAAFGASVPEKPRLRAVPDVGEED